MLKVKPPAVSNGPLVSIPEDPSKPFILKLSPQNAVKFMPKELRQHYLNVRAKSRQVLAGQIECVHELGRIIADALEGRAPYGEKAAHWLAAALGANLTFIYRAMAFYKAFPDLDVVLEYVRRGAEVSYDLTLTHFQEVAKEGDSRKRAGLLEASLDGQLSTRALAKLVRAQGERRAPEGPVLALPRNLRGAVLNIGLMTKNLAEALDRVVPDHLLARLAALNAELTRPDEFGQIAALTDGMEDLSRALADYAGRIADCLARVRGAGGGEAEAAEHEELGAPGATQAEVEEDAPTDPHEADGPAPPEQSVKKKRGRPHEIVVD